MAGSDLSYMESLPGVLHDALIGTGHVQRFALLRRKDSIVKANSQNFMPTPEEVVMIVDAFKKPEEFGDRPFKFQGCVYTTVRSDRAAIYALAMSPDGLLGASDGGRVKTGGFVAVKTNLFVVVSIYDESMYPAVCVEATEKLAQYFKNKGK